MDSVADSTPTFFWQLFIHKKWAGGLKFLGLFLTETKFSLRNWN